jgi:hypothetical protein
VVTDGFLIFAACFSGSSNEFQPLYMFHTFQIQSNTDLKEEQSDFTGTEYFCYSQAGGCQPQYTSAYLHCRRRGNARRETPCSAADYFENLFFDIFLMLFYAYPSEAARCWLYDERLCPFAV